MSKRSRSVDGKVYPYTSRDAAWEDFFSVIAMFLALAFVGGAIAGGVFLVMWSLWTIPLAAILAVVGFYIGIKIIEG